VTSVTLRPGALGSKMRSVTRRPAFAGSLLLAALLAVIVTAGPASAQSTSPSVTSGQVTGSLVQGGTLTIRVDALMPGGWQGLHLVEASVLAGGSVLEKIVFDVEENKLTIGESSTVVGTGGVAEGTYLRASGADVVVTKGGGNLTFRLDANVVKTITQDPRFKLGVVDDFGASDEVTLKLAEPRSAGITWGTVATLIAAALFAGGFVGNVFATKRRPPPRASVYDAVQRRVETDRAAKGRST